jgi:hypothetical protein
MEKAEPARHQIKAVYVEAVVAAGIATQRTYVMANIKYKYAAQLEAIHNQWCLENGYPLRSYDSEPGRPKITSSQAQKRKRPSLQPRVQASSLKPQAPRS